MNTEEVKKIMRLVAEKMISSEDAEVILEHWKSQGKQIKVDPAIFDMIKKSEAPQAPKGPQLSQTPQTSLNLHDILSHEIITLASKALKMEPNEISLKTAMKNFGIDSISASEITMHFKEKYKIPLTPPMLFEVRNLGEYIEQLITQFHAEIAAYYPDKIPIASHHPDPLVTPPGVAAEDDQNVTYIKEEALFEGKHDLDSLWANMEKEELEGEKINLMITQVKPLKGNSIIISIGDNILEFISFGEGPPILLIGGFSCDYSIWQFLLPMLTIHRKVIVYYPPGYGKSTLPQSATSWIDIASLLSQGLKHLNISHPIPVLGYSTGGAIALELALNFPAQVKSLGLISTSPMPNPKNEVFQLAMKELESIEPLLKHGTDLMPFGGTEVAKYTGILMRNYDVTNQLSHILCPTVVICGAADEVISPEMSKILQNGIKNSKLFTIQNTGHYAIITHADEIFKNIGEII